MKIIDFLKLTSQLEDEQFPISKDDLSEEFRQHSGDYIADILDGASKEEFDSVEMIAEWLDDNEKIEIDI